MPKFIVTIREVDVYETDVEIDADNADAAKSKARELRSGIDYKPIGTDAYTMIPKVSEISFKTKTAFTGRNGTFQAAGLLITGRDPIKIQPITPRGRVGRCSIQVPIESVLELIAALREAQYEYVNEEIVVPALKT